MEALPAHPELWTPSDIHVMVMNGAGLRALSRILGELFRKSSDEQMFAKTWKCQTCPVSEMLSVRTRF